VSSTALRYLTSIPQGTGLCATCHEPVQEYQCMDQTLMPMYCPTCLTKNQLEADREAARKAHRVLYAKQKLRPGLEHCSFSSYRPNGNSGPYGRCLLYAETFRPSDGHGLALQGGVGTGKTHLAVSIARRIPGAFVINAVDLLEAIRDSFDGTPTKVYRTATDAPLLVLDDMGKAKPTEWALERFYHLINFRIENLLPIIITTNDDPRSWDMHWTPAIADRVRGACELIEFAGLSHRAQKR